MDWYGKQALADTPLTELTYYGEAAGQVVNVDNFTFALVFFIFRLPECFSR